MFELYYIFKAAAIVGLLMLPGYIIIKGLEREGY